MNGTLQNENKLVGTLSGSGSVTGGVGTVFGKDGKSAYEIAVKNGFEGTEAEWLASLKGDRGNSGVYVGTGDMPDDCYVQINPEGIVADLGELGLNVDKCFQYRYKYTVITGADSVGNKISNILDVGCFAIVRSHYTDFPTDYPNNTSASVFNMQTTGNYGLQILFHNGNGMSWFRIIRRTDKVVTQDWTRTDIVRMKILALGDSICYGKRNDKKGFVGDLGVPYKNIGLSGATLSNSRTDVTNIPDQLVGVTDYQPDIIIANGGVNDYYRNVEMGTLSAFPVSTDAEAEALDRSTVMGGLEYLFYKMISLYPKAQRFFLITHKTYATAYNGAGHKSYWVTTPNQAGYTQQELHDAIVECCKAYNVNVIDVYNDSNINSLFAEYRSDVNYDTDKSVTNTEYVDSDGIHPLAYGYKEGYVPIVKKAIVIGTAK